MRRSELAKCQRVRICQIRQPVAIQSLDQIGLEKRAKNQEFACLNFSPRKGSFFVIIAQQKR